MLATSSVKLGSSMLGKTTFKRSLGSYGLLTFMLCLMVSWSFRDRVDFSEYALKLGMRKSDEMYFIGLPFGGGTNQLISVTIGIELAKNLNRTFLVPPKIHTSHSPRQKDSHQTTRSWFDFIDFNLSSDYRIHDIHPHDLPSNFFCHPPPGPFITSGVEPPAKIFLEAFNTNVSVPEENWTNTTDMVVMDPTIITEALTRLDSSKPISCVSTIFARVKGLTFEPQKKLVYQPWLLGAVELFIKNAREGVSGTWTERLATELPELMPSTTSEEIIRQFAELHQIFESEKSLAGGEEEPKKTIGVHWRRGDFEWWCLAKPKAPACFPSLSSSLSQILDLKSKTCSHKETCQIIVATNTKVEEEISSFKSAGMVFINHTELETLDSFGLFADSIFDLAMLDSPLLTGFMGNHYSTISNWVRSRRGWRGNPVKTTLEFL